MKNDYDDYDDYETGASRWVSVMVLLLAVAGFMALAWYAYHTGSQQAKVDGDDVVVVQADPSPIKEQPQEAGGEEFPHQEKTIFDALSASGEAPEKPVVMVEDPAETEKEIVAAVEEAEKPAHVPANEKITEVIQDAMKEGKTAADKAEDEKAAEALKPKKIVEEAPVAKTPDPFAPVEAAPPAKAPEPIKPAPIKPTPIAAPVVATPPAPAASVGGAQIQLGAYGSQAEAEQNWAKIRGAHSDVIGSMSHMIVRADLGAKGVFYRLRVGGFGSQAAAKQTCAMLSGRGQGCFLVK